MPKVLLYCTLIMRYKKNLCGKHTCNKDSSQEVLNTFAYGELLAGSSLAPLVSPSPSPLGWPLNGEKHHASPMTALSGQVPSPLPQVLPQPGLPAAYHHSFFTSPRASCGKPLTLTENQTACSVGPVRLLNLNVMSIRDHYLPPALSWVTFCSPNMPNSVSMPGSAPHYHS